MTIIHLFFKKAAIQRIVSGVSLKHLFYHITYNLMMSGDLKEPINNALRGHRTKRIIKYAKEFRCL